MASEGDQPSEGPTLGGESRPGTPLLRAANM